MTSCDCVGLQLYGSGGLPCAHARAGTSGLLLDGSIMARDAPVVALPSSASKKTQVRRRIRLLSGYS